MSYKHNTYDRRVQLGASRRRREDARILQDAEHWASAMYIGGYAIECSLCALICYSERVDNLKDTTMYRKGTTGSALHNLQTLLGALPKLTEQAMQRAIRTDRTGQYQNAWTTIGALWQKDALRYWDKKGTHPDCKRFMDAVGLLHDYILSQQGVTS